MRLKNPTSAKTAKVKRWHIHAAIWTLVLIIAIGVLSLDVMGGDFVLGFCSSGLSDRESLLILNVIPIGIYWMTGFGFLIGSGVLLRQHLQYTSRASRVVLCFVLFCFVSFRVFLVCFVAVDLYCLHLCGHAFYFGIFKCVTAKQAKKTKI